MPDSNEYLAKRAYVDTQLAQKQDTLIAGQNITIGPDGKTISATGGGETYTAGTGINISQQNEIGLSAQTQATLAYLDQNKQDKLVAGDGISIEGNIISATGGGGGGSGGGAAKPEVLWENQTTPFKSGTLTVPHLSEWLQVGYCVYPNSDIMSVGTPAMGEGGLGAYNMDAIWNIAHRFNYNSIAETITIDQYNQGIYHSTDVYNSTYNGGDGIYKIIGLIKKPSTEPSTDTCIKSYTASGTTDTYGYFPIDLQNGTVDPENVFSVVAAENNEGNVCTGLVWDSNGVLNGIYMSKSVSGIAQANKTLSYTVFYYDDSVDNSCVNTYTVTYTTSAYGNIAIDLQNGDIDPFSIFAVTVDSSSSTSDILCSGVHWWTDGNPKTIDAAFMYGKSLGSIYSSGQITYKVFYYTRANDCIKTIETNITTTSTGEGELLIDSVDPNKVFSVIMTDDLPAGSSGDETMSRGLVLSSGSISALFANGWAPTTAKSNITFPATIFYLDDGGVVPPEPSKQEVITHTTAEWAQLTSLVSEKDVIYIWSDYKVKDGTPIPAMKVGDGDAYVLDLPFATQAITEDDITKWNTVTSKVSARVEGNVLILE